MLHTKTTLIHPSSQCSGLGWLRRERKRRLTNRERFKKHQTLYDALHCVAGQRERAGQVAALATDRAGQRSVHQRPSVALRQWQAGRQRCRTHEALQRVHGRPFAAQNDDERLGERAYDGWRLLVLVLVVLLLLALVLLLGCSHSVEEEKGG